MSKSTKGNTFELQDRTHSLLELLYHVSREVASALDLRTVLQRVLYEAIQNVGGERGTIVVLDDSGHPVDATIVYGKHFHEHTTQQLRDTVERGLAGWVLRNRKAALIPDTSHDERWLQRPDDARDKTGAKSAICVPLMARERIVGVLTLVHSVPNTFGPEHLELMQAIADQAGIAVLNARLYTESQRQARVMSALAECAAAINMSLELEEVLQRILHYTMQALQVETAALALKDSVTGELVFRAAAGHNAGHILDRRIPAGKGLSGQVVSSGRGLVIPAVKEDERFEEVDNFGGIEICALAMAPILAQGKVIGVLEAVNPASGVFDPDALLVMNGIGSLAGTAIQNAQLFGRLDAAHQRYRELFDTSMDPIFITDWEGNILEANRQAVAMSEFPDEKLHEMTIDQVHEVVWSKVGLEFESLKTYQPCSYTSLLHKMSGHYVHVEVTVRAVNFEEAEALQWTIRDISERKALDDLRNDLTAMVYHDLRSPLSNIISSLEILGGMIEADETVQSILTIASSSTARVERLVSSLLDINRLELGQPIVNQKSTDVSKLIVEAIKIVQPGIESRNQKVKTNLSASQPLVWVDADMILRVMINLLENAAKFSPVGSEIIVSASKEDGWVKVAVQDNGPGIPILDRERIFNKFTRLRVKDKTAGLGIGLAFCRMAVEGHGGKIWVESENNVGSTFFFTLPIAAPEQQGIEKAD